MERVGLLGTNSKLTKEAELLKTGHPTCIFLGGRNEERMFCYCYLNQKYPIF